MKKIIRNIFGVISLIIGMIGGLIPILQGWVFVLLGYILLDFKRKEQFEEKIINFLGRYKFSKKLADIWLLVKRKNKSVICDNKDKIRNIYHNIDRDLE